MTLISLEPNDVHDRIQRGKAVLVDIRDSDEFARRHIPGALSRPIAAFEQAHLRIDPDNDVIFTCRSGMRTAACSQRLKDAVLGDAFVLNGGVDGWARAGLPVRENARAPLEMMRQVQIGAGFLVLAGVTLGFAIHPAFYLLAAGVGAGLTFAGATGFCGMARILAVMPWNRAA
jgi:rhodanese-related sulfurtransferase